MEHSPMVLMADSWYVDRVWHLREINHPWESERIRIRDVMNGGEGAVKALLGDSRIGQDITTVNMLESGMNRLSQKLGIPPTLKIHPPRGKESDAQRNKAAKRRRLVDAYDDLSQVDLMMPQLARWMPGYGFGVLVHMPTKWGDHWYPAMELRDSFDCWPGWYGPQQHPFEIAFVRQADESWVAHHYPQFDAARKSIKGASSRLIVPGGGSYAGFDSKGTYDASWEGDAGEVTIVEYYDMDGSHLVAPGYGLVLQHIPNPVPNMLPFNFGKRYSFDRLKGQYDGMLGMMAMMAKLNVLALIASEDAVFRETNVIGDMEGTKYNRGRFAVNYFQPGTRVERPGGDVAFGVFQQIDRVERQMRIQGQYSVIEDSQSPNSYVTGRGLDSLTASADQNVNEYQRVIARMLERADAYRLAWDELHTAGSTRKPMPSPAVDEDYRPSQDIKGMYATKRMYGVMAGWDEPQKIVTALQLLQAGIIDIETVQENLSGIDDVNQIRERNRRDGAEGQLIQSLAMRAQQGDPAATMALVEIYQNPDDMDTILARFFTPQEPQMSPEEQAMMMGGMGGPLGPGAMTAGNQPPPVSTVLSQLGMGGEVEGGIQTVGRLPER
jgi:hypothetical protein